MGEFRLLEGFGRISGPKVCHKAIIRMPEGSGLVAVMKIEQFSDVSNCFDEKIQGTGMCLSRDLKYWVEVLF